MPSASRVCAIGRRDREAPPEKGKGWHAERKPNEVRAMAETKTKEAVQHVLDTSFSFVLLFGNSQYAIFGGLKKILSDSLFIFRRSP